MMTWKELKNRKYYRASGLMLAVAGLGLSVWGFFVYQIASADVTVAQRSDFGLAMIITGAVLIIGAIITFTYLVLSDFV